MTKSRTYNLLAAAAYIGVKYQAVQERFGKTYLDAATGRHHIPLAALTAWRKERLARAKQLTAEPQKAP